MARVAFVTRVMQVGGAEGVIAQLVKYLVSKNIKCNIVMVDGGDVSYQLPEEVDIHSIGRKSKGKVLDKLLQYREVRRYLQLQKPDVVLTLPEDIGIYVIPALLGTGIPVVVSERNNPWVMPWKRETRLMRQLFYPLASGIVFQTELAASFFPRSIQRKGVVLPNPLDLERLPYPAFGKRRKEVIGAGRLDRQKNFSLLIKAFAEFHQRHQDYVLTIYGEGSLRHELESLAASLLPLGAYSFPGRSKDLPHKITNAAMFVLSSDYEGMPNVVIEAMALGTPVISTNCPSGGPEYLIQSGENGLLVPVGDVGSLVDAMCELAVNEAYAKKIGKNAMRIREVLNSNLVAEQWLKYLSGVGGFTT